MKHLLFTICALFGLAGFAAAQEDTEKPQPGKSEIIEKIIIAHITQKLELTVDEAQKFWPVFNNYKAEYRSAITNHKDDPIKRDEELLAVKKKYKPDFQRVLNSEKRANKVFTVFEDALRTIMDKRKERRDNPPPNRPGLQRRGRQQNS